MCVRDSPNGTIGNFTNGTIGSKWYHYPERFSEANGTIGANVTIGGNVGNNGTIGSPKGTIGKPNSVNSKIIHLAYFHNLYFFMCIFQYFYYLPISSDYALVICNHGAPTPGE